MTCHANLGARHAGERRRFDRSVTVATVDPVVTDMMLVAEWHRLLKWHIDRGGVGRPEDCRSRPAATADENDEAENDDLGVDVGARRKELGHERTRALL